MNYNDNSDIMSGFMYKLAQCNSIAGLGEYSVYISEQVFLFEVPSVIISRFKYLLNKKSTQSAILSMIFPQ